MFDYRKDNLFIKAIIHELGHLIVGYIHGIVNTNNLIKLYVKADADRIDGHIIISDNYDCSDEEYVRFIMTHNIVRLDHGINMNCTKLLKD